MPIQTGVKDNIQIADGCMVEIDDGSGFVDLGAFDSDIVATLTYDTVTIQSSNAGDVDEYASNMQIDWSGTLINLNPVGVQKLSAGMLTTEVTTGAAVTTAADQTIAAGWTNMKSIPLEAFDPTTGVKLRFSAAPTLTSVTGDTAGALTVNEDYFIQEDVNSYSGYSILLNTAGLAGLVTTEIVTVDYASITPISKTTVYGGASVSRFSAVAMRMTHTDDNGLIRRLNLPRVVPNTGWNFGFKSAETQGAESMDLTATAKLKSTLTTGKQLFSWEVDTGAI